jgi:hypothetical protein
LRSSSVGVTAGRALLRPAPGGDEVLGEGVDVLERLARLLGRRGEDQRVRGVADPLLLGLVQLGGPDIPECPDDATVCLCAFARHISLIARIRRGLTEPGIRGSP